LNSLAPIFTEIPVIAKRIADNTRLHEHPALLAGIATTAVPRETPLDVRVARIVSICA
jgi:hypothetical protein